MCYVVCNMPHPRYVIKNNRYLQMYVYVYLHAIIVGRGMMFSLSATNATFM